MVSKGYPRGHSKGSVFICVFKLISIPEFLFIIWNNLVSSPQNFHSFMWLEGSYQFVLKCTWVKEEDEFLTWPFPGFNFIFKISFLHTFIYVYLYGQLYSDDYVSKVFVTIFKMLHNPNKRKMYVNEGQISLDFLFSKIV